MPNGKPTTVFDRDMTEAEERPLAGGRATVFSSRCPGHDGSNEDAAAIINVNESAGVLVVADGLGGSAAGAAAAAAAVLQVCKSVDKAARNESLLRTAILDGFELANEAVRAIGVGAGTTLAVIEIQDGAVRPYHVGDSAILLVGARGKLKYQSIAHSPIGYGVEAGLIAEDEAMHHEDRHIVSNVIGTPEMHIEIGPTLKLAARDTLIVMSDGLADNLHAEEIVERIRKGSIATAAKALALDARTRMAEPSDGMPSKPDDLTFIVFRPRRSKS